MNVFLIAPSRSQGLQDYTHNLARGLEDSGVMLTVLVHEDYSWDSEKPNFRSVFVDNTLENLKNTVGELRTHTPDVVHSQSTNLGLLAVLLLLRPLFGYKLVLTPHSSKSHWERPIYNRFQPVIYNQFDGVIWHTEQDASRMADAGVSTSQAVIEHGNYAFYAEKTDLTQEEARAELDLPPEQTMFLFFGYLRPDKRLDLLLDAFARLPETLRGESFLVIAGEPTDESGFEEYAAAIAEKEIEDSVYAWSHFIESKDLPFFFESADVVTTPYDTISESGIMHIAFAFGKPIVATNVEGFCERLQHENAILFEQGDVEGLCEALAYSIRNPSEMEAIGEANETRSQQNEWNQIGDETTRFYSHLLD